MTLAKGYEIKVLDDGFVRYVDHMGGDEDIVESARISTARGFVSWERYQRCKRCDWIRDYRSAELPGCVIPAMTLGAKQAHEDGSIEHNPVHHPAAKFEKHEWADFPRGDLGVLDYMMANEHGTPFEMCEIKLHIRMPMDAWRQHIRHRTAAVNEYSTRYSPAIDSTAKTAPDKWRLQGATNRQGSGGFLPAGREDPMVPYVESCPGRHLSEQEARLQAHAREIYEERLNMGVAKEQARKDLPLSTYTEAYWKVDLRNLLHYLGLRLHPHAQEEIRAYARAIADITKALWPRTWAIFDERVLGGVRLSRSEVAIVREALRRSDFAASGDVGPLLKKLGV